MRPRITILLLFSTLLSIGLLKALPGASSAHSALLQTESHNVRRIPLFATDVVFERNSGKLYASVPSKAGATGNSIARLDPVTAQLESTVFVGSEPGKLALSDDGQALYVSLDGTAAVRRFNLPTQTAGLQFPLSDLAGNAEPLFVKDMAVAPGNPNLVAVSRRNTTGSPDFEGVAVYDNGVKRPLTTPRHTGSDFIGFNTSSTTLFGFSAGGGGLQKMSIGPSGVTVTNTTSVNTPGGDFKIDQGLMYLPFGQTYNAETGLLVGTFTLSGPGSSLSVEPDSSVGRVYFLTGDTGFDDFVPRTYTIRAFSQQTFVPVGTLDITNVTGRPTSLIRWGANGLAFGTSTGQFYLIQTTLVPSNEPVPTPTPTPSPTATPTPTPTPTPAPGDLREVAITAKDIVINPVTQTVYASVPSSAGAGGNSITPFDPVSGNVGQPVFVGSEPNKLSISDNAQVIYVGLDGANAVRRFDVASGIAGSQFTVGGNQSGPFVPVDIAVAPGHPETTAIVRGDNPNSARDVALYDNGVQRPTTTGLGHTINVIQYSSSPNIFYGHNNSNSEAGFRKMAAVDCGVSVLSVKQSLLQGFDFQIEDGLAYSTSGRVADPETGVLVGTFPVSADVPLGSAPQAVFADAKAGRVYFFRVQNMGFPSSQTMLVRAYDIHTFLHVGTLAVPNILGWPTAVVRWGVDGFAIRTSGDKVYLLRTSLIQPPLQPPPVAAPTPTPPTYTLRGVVSSSIAPLPTATMRLSGGGQNASVTTAADGTFAFPNLPFCTTFIVTPDPIPNFTFSPGSVTLTPDNQNNVNLSTAFFQLLPHTIGFQPGTSVGVGEGGTVVLNVRRFNGISTSATVKYETVGVTASDRSDFNKAIGTLRFAAGESVKQVTVFTADDVRDEPDETLTLTLSEPTGGFLGTQPSIVITIVDNDDPNILTNPVDDAQFFVRQQYRDFLNRNPDQDGFLFWVNEITSCGSDTACTEIKRINVSAAFFLSIEFQHTGYLVYKSNQAAFNSGEQLDFNSFLADTQELGRGVIIGQAGAEAQLELNKQSFFLDFVQRPAFLASGAFPITLSAAEFVDKLNANTLDPLNPASGPALTATQRDELVTQLSVDPTSPAKRAQVLRAISENSVFSERHSSKAFVLMQYFGYLRREPDDAPDTNFDGYNFWLGKLNQFSGNFIQAEMVKAFISSLEYRQRFGP